MSFMRPKEDELLKDLFFSSKLRIYGKLQCVVFLNQV